MPLICLAILGTVILSLLRGLLLRFVGVVHLVGWAVADRRVKPFRSSERTPGARNAPPPTIGISVVGEFDVAAVPSLAIEPNLLIHDHSRTVADLRECYFCDASGLDLLITTDMALRARGGGLTLLGPCPALQFLLDTFGPAVGIELVTSA